MQDVTRNSYSKTPGLYKGEKYDDEEIIKLFYPHVTNRQMSSAEKFVDYLYRIH
jgi:hypothetical protein